MSRPEPLSRKGRMSEIRDPYPEEFAEASSGASFAGGAEENGGRQVHVLLIEDDCAIRQMIENYLAQHGMHVVSAADRGGVARHLSDEPSLIILDLQLGKDDGLDLLRAIRSRSDVPIITTRAHRRDEVDRVVGLNSALTTISPSRLDYASCWRASGPCCGAGRPAWRRRVATPHRGAAVLAAAGSLIAVCVASPIPTILWSR